MVHPSRSSKDLKSCFISDTEKIKQHPLFTDFYLPTKMEKIWTIYLYSKLSAGSLFNTFLDVVEAKNRDTGFEDIADAAHDNRMEEIGYINGKYKSEQNHSTWRRQAKSFLESIYPLKYLPQITRVVDLYRVRMEDLMSRESALQNAATFTAFELLTKYEYEEVLKVFKQRLLYTQYDSQFLRYFSSHAKHEQRHFEEAFEPLLAASKEDDGNYRQVRSGLKSACFTKHQFLDNVLREAEKKK